MIVQTLSLLSKYRGSNTTPPPPPPPAPTPAWKAAQTGNITFTDADFQASKPGVQMTGYVCRNTNGFVEFRTTETAIDVKIGGNHAVTGQYAMESDCEVLVDGVYHSSVRLTVVNATQSIPVTLPAGLKTVRLVNGYRIPDNGGTFIQGVVTTGNIEIKTPYVPTDKWLFLGDSITTGASGTHPALTGFAGQFRADGDYFVQVDSWGARHLYYTRTQARNTALEISQQLNGTNYNRLSLHIGTNNFGLNNDSTTIFQTIYGWLLDEIRAIRPDIEIWCVSPINRTNYSTPNTNGATLEDYDTAIKTLVVARAGVKYVYGKTLVSLANLPDGLHPSQVGMDEYYTNLKARILAGGDTPTI